MPRPSGGLLTPGKPRPTELHPAAPVAYPTCPVNQSLLADAGLHAVVPEVVEVHDLSRLSPADAAQLDGKGALYRVVIDGPRDRQGDRDVYEILPAERPAAHADRRA